MCTGSQSRTGSILSDLSIEDHMFFNGRRDARQGVPFQKKAGDQLRWPAAPDGQEKTRGKIRKL